MGAQLATVPGSLAATQQAGRSLAESFMSADMIVMVDTSASMGERDVLECPGVTRYQAACDELTRIQASNPGRIAVVSFSDGAEFCPGGIPRNLAAGTRVAEALKFVQLADDCGITFVLVSDGEAQDAESALAIARRFKSPIQTIFIGSGPGASFLSRLATLTGGSHATRTIPQLGATIAGLLPSAR